LTTKPYGIVYKSLPGYLKINATAIWRKWHEDANPGREEHPGWKMEKKTGFLL
jgi:hypothetical protein